MDKDDKKRRLREWRESQRTAAHAALPLPDSEMLALFNMLDERLPSAGCDHTRRLTTAWLDSRQHAHGPVLQWLDDNGGFCDCEVLANAEQAWEAAGGRRGA